MLTTRKTIINFTAVLLLVEGTLRTLYLQGYLVATQNALNLDSLVNL